MIDLGAIGNVQTEAYFIRMLIIMIPPLGSQLSYGFYEKDFKEIAPPKSR